MAISAGEVTLLLTQVKRGDQDALKRLSELDPQQGKVVEMRYFGGLTEEEIAEALGVTSRTVRREWATARLWLHAELSGGGGHDT